MVGRELRALHGDPRQQLGHREIRDGTGRLSRVALGLRGVALAPDAALLRLCEKQGGSDLGQLALRRPLSGTDRASGCPELRPASANQPLGPRWPAI